MRFKIDWASLIVGSKFTVFALFYFVFEGNFPSASPRGAYIWRGRFNGGFLALPDWGAYIWRGLYMEGLIFGILRYVVPTEESPLCRLTSLLLVVRTPTVASKKNNYHFHPEINKTFFISCCCPCRVPAQRP